MKLTEQDADLFFDLTWALQFYVNQHLNIIPNTGSIEQYADYSLEEKYPDYNVFFGGGTKARLKESYLTAKQNNKIIETLGTAQIDQAESNKTITPATNLQPHIEELLKLAKKLKANADHPAINRPIFNLGMGMQ